MVWQEQEKTVIGTDGLAGQAEALLSGQQDLVANAANLSALLFHSLENVSWVGFYFVKNGELVVGPFQGKPACVTIPMGKGVCGTAAETGKIQRIADVHEFEGHIACDAASKSELVLPVIKNGRLLGVLDLDSPVKNRFSSRDELLMKEILEIFINSLG
ncbi:MAG: GAF domain-containing protein [Gammaproteobacteria bacterium]|jgi:GAF domain-containing protein|nr:GAF domain-containing protein [Gammaproteobacteria bacterium]